MIIQTKRKRFTYLSLIFGSISLDCYQIDNYHEKNCEVLVTQLCPTLCNPTECSSPSSSVQNSPGKNTRVGSHSFFEGIFPNQGSNPESPASQAESLPSEPLGKPKRRF